MCAAENQEYYYRKKKMVTGDQLAIISDRDLLFLTTVNTATYSSATSPWVSVKIFLSKLHFYLILFSSF